MILSLILYFKVTYGISVYTTPALDMQFGNFMITDYVPEKGEEGGGETQNQVLIKKHYVIFQFKGSGNALILFEKHAGEIGGLAAVFMVEIGGDTKCSRVGIYDSPDPESISTNTLSSRTVPNITSVSEYRFFWIQWNAEDPSVRVGRGNALYEGEILVAKGSDLEKYNIQSSLDQIIAVSISTTISNIGYWRFNIPAKATDTSTMPVVNQSVVTETEHSQTPMTFSRLATTFSDASTPGALNNPAIAQFQSSVEIALTPQTFSLTSTLTVSNKDTFHLSTATNVSNKHSKYLFSSNYSTATISTDQGKYKTSKVPLNQPETAAVIAIVTFVAILSTFRLAMYFIKRKCTEVIAMNGGVGDEEQNDRHSRNNTAR